MTDDQTPKQAIAEPLPSPSPAPMVPSSIIESHSELSREWRRLSRVATLIAICTSPAVFFWFHHHNRWGVAASIVGAFFTIVAFRGVVDIIVRRVIPWPSLFGTEDARLREEDIVNRRRAWTWRWFLRFGRLLLILNTLIWLVRPNTTKTVAGWAHTPGWIWSKLGGLMSSQTFWVQVAFGFGLFFINIIIFLGPLLAMGISQIRGFEPGDAEWGVKLEHVRGQAEAKEDVRRVVTLWQSGELFEVAGGKRERGLLFLGPPGTGKTMLAKAIATGFNSPFVTIPGSGFAQTFIGVDAIIVRFLARKAKKLANKWGGQCIVFIDEIDAVGMRRRALGQATTGTEDWNQGFYGPYGAHNPSGDLIIENREWREWMFQHRAPEVTSPYPNWARKIGEIMNQGIIPGMMGMGGGLALNQLLVVMDGIDNPPFMRRVMTNKVNSFLDAVYVVPRRLNKLSGQVVALGLTLLGFASIVDAILLNVGVGHAFVFGKVTLSVVEPLLGIYFCALGYLVWRQIEKAGTCSVRLPRAKANGSQIYFIGATNVPLDNLDPALTRPGRMGRHVTFRTPTKDDRKDIFDLYLDKVAHDPDLDSPARRDEIARITNGYSPAMIDQICSMALTNAHHEGRAVFGWGDLVEAMTVVESGTAVGVQYTDSEAKATAIHEAGHAAAAHVYRPGLESSRLSIRMRGRSMGHHQSFEKEERFIHYQSELFGGLIHGLGAMAAEIVFYGENSNGVGGDLHSATAEAATMVGQWGMAPEPLKFADGDLPVPAAKPATRALGRGRRRDLDRMDDDGFDDESPEETREREIKNRLEKIGLRLMNRTRGGAMTGDPIASALGDPRKRQLAAQLLGEAFVLAYNLMVENKAAIERIADTVVEKKEIYGDDLIRLLDRQNLRKPEIDWTSDAIWPKV